MAKMKPPPLHEVEFGALDASEEAIDNPELLIKGFYDFREAAYSIAAGQTWLLLGPKGAGKSAVLEHLRLIWQDQFECFFLGWNMQDFPVADVTQMRTGELSAASRAQTAWRFLLLLRVIESLSRDQGVRNSPAFDGVVSDLKNGGLLSSDWKSKIVRWSKTQAKIKLPVAELGVELSHDEVDTIRATDILSSVLQDVRTDSQHLIALDGLDQFFFEVEQEWRSLAGLTHAIASVNKLFRETGQRISIVAAIRSDIFDVLPSPESNKLKPHAIQLDWSALGIGAGNKLWELVGAKAAVSRPAARDIVKIYLRQPISVGPHTEIAEYFLDNTRLLPRDLIALLNILKTVHPGSTPVTEQEARDTVTQYCDEYFQGEILNNLAGIIREDGARKLAEFRDALRVLPTRRFTFDDVQGELNGSLDPRETKALLKQMFEVGGLGVRNPSGRGPEYTDFVYRSITRAGFTIRYGFLLHNALVRAWNRPW